MNVKIDTKEKFHVIIPESSVLSANMSEEFADLLNSFINKPTPHVILCLKHLKEIDTEMVELILTTQSFFYEHNHSFVICEINKALSPLFEDSLNVTPTESEAWDIVQMEEMERELLNNFDNQ